MSKNPATMYDEQCIPKPEEERSNMLYKNLTVKEQDWHIFDNVNNPVWILNDDQTIIYINKTAEKLFQTPGAAAIGKDYWEILRCKETRVKLYPDKFTRYSHTREKIELKIENEWFQITSDPILNTEGDYNGSVCIARDITMRKQAEKALQDAENKYSMLFDKMLNAFALHEIICDENGKPVDYRYLKVNPAFEKITGIKFNKLGRTAFEIWPDMDDFFIEIYGKVALTGEPVSFEFFSKYTSQHFIVTAYQSDEGQFVSLYQDVTEQKQAEKALRESEQNLTKAHALLERRVYERTEELEKANESLQKKTKKLEDVNTALSVLLEKREMDREKNQDKILLNVKEHLIPHLKKLKKSPLTEYQKTNIRLLERGLKEIISPFSQKLTYRNMYITPRELQVANLVKDGKTSKEIAEILLTSERAVVFHRTNLRKKLGLKKKSNLRTYLMSLS